MGLARQYQICIEEIPYYMFHVDVFDEYSYVAKTSVTSLNFEHRRKGVVQCMKNLTNLFAVDVYSYAVISKHYHLIPKLNSTIDWSKKRTLTT